MDIQLKRGLLDVCVLAAIKDEDSYGYKIIKDVSPFIQLSDDGRLRKYYHITSSGIQRIDDFREDWKEIMTVYNFVTKEEKND